MISPKVTTVFAIYRFTTAIASTAKLASIEGSPSNGSNVLAGGRAGS
jgi:hypothetical protein